MLGGRCSNPFISVSLETLSVFSYISPMLFEYIVKECSYQVIFFYVYISGIIFSKHKSREILVRL